MDPRLASWNRIGEWMRQIDQLRVLGHGSACLRTPQLAPTASTQPIVPLSVTGDELL